MLCAKYMILETQPKCTVDASPDNTLEGDRVRLICEVVYNGTNIVSLVWKGVDDASAAVKSGITISRSFSVAASPPVIPAFSCITSFEVKDEYTHLATNIPSVTCETRTVKVQCKYLIHDTTCNLVKMPIYSFKKLFNCKERSRSGRVYD